MAPYFTNPFKKHDPSEFQHVYRPLGDSRRKSSIVSLPKKSLDGKEKDVEDGDAGAIPAANTLDSLRAEIDADIAASGHDSVYDRKSKIVNKAITDIGMGRYQWELFVLCGFGWFADNLWLQGVALTLPSLTPEFGVPQERARYTTMSLFIGLCIGASFWGVASDVIGRRPAFNATLFIAGVFGLAVGGSPTWVGVCGMYAALGCGVGGNLPVDGALFLEFLPFASGNLLTALSVWWPVGQLVGSLIAWGFLAQYSCTIEQMPCSMTDNAPGCCAPSANMGWRYFNLTMGALTMFMFICRFFVFHLFESPKFLLSKGRQSEAVASVYGIAAKNKTTTWLNEEILNEIGGQSALGGREGLTFAEVVKRQAGKFSTQRIGPLFRERKLGTMTALLWFCWATIGMAYPLFNAFLPQYLTNSNSDQPTSPNIVYRNYAITSVVGVPGSLLACWTVDLKYIGRKGTIAFSTVVTGVLLFCFTVSTDPNVQVGMTSLEAFFQNIAYGVLYAYTPEVFPAPVRGTGTGIASFFNRLMGLFAPVIGANASSVNPKVPIYVSGALFLAAFVAMLFFPIETRGKAKL